jgi:5,10-methylenetetrahydrofolate reductase
MSSKFREDVKNNLPILIGFYPILNNNALSGLWFKIEGKIAFVPRYYQKTLKGL